MNRRDANQFLWRQFLQRRQILIIRALVFVLISASAIATIERTAMRVEPLPLPPCIHCTKPQKVVYSAPKPHPKVFWWYDGYSCATPCID